MCINAILNAQLM